MTDTANNCTEKKNNILHATEQSTNSEERHSASNINDSVQQTRAKDSGWAWIIALSASFHVFIMVGLAKSFGLFFVQFIEAYDTNSSMLSIVLAIQTLVVSLSSLFVLNLGSKILGNRKLVIIGGVLSSLGYIINAFAPNEEILVLSQGFVYGVGCACTTGPIYVVLNSYFEKRLGLAYSITSIGGSIGSLVLPMFIQKLLEEYGLQGTLLLCSGLILNNVIVGVLMRPFESELNLVKNKQNEEVLLAKETDNVEMKEISLSDSNVPKYSEKMNDELLILPSHLSTAQILNKTKKRIRSYSERCYLDEDEEIINVKRYNSLKNLMNKISESNVNIYGLTTAETIGSLESVNIKQYIQSQNENKFSTVKTRTKNFFHFLKDFSILKNHRFQLILFAAFFSFCGCVFINVYIPAFAKDNGITNEKAAILLTIIGVCDLVARTTVGLISDSKKIRRSHILGTTLGITGLATLFNPFYRNFQTFVIYSSTYGLFGSVYFSLITIVIRDAVGGESIPAALSLQILVHGLASIVFAPVLGYLRNTTGSYMATYYVLGVGLLLGSIAVFCEPLMARKRKRRIKEESNDISINITKT